MPVKTICNPNVATVERTADIAEAARLMRHEHVGDLIVTEVRESADVPVGILTDRDIVVEVVAKGIDPHEVTVADTMSRDMLTVHEDNGIAHALEDMREAGVRRAPVVSNHGALVGVLTVDDVVGHVSEQLGNIAGVIRNEQRIESKLRP